MAFTEHYFPEFLALSDHWETILEEIEKVDLTWFNWDSDAVGKDGTCMFLTGGWTVSPIYFGKKTPEEVVEVEDKGLMAEVCQLCRALPRIFPETTDLLQGLPSINYAALSRLAPRSRLETHRHENPNALIMHMGLRIPRDCGLKVGEEEHTWRKPGDVVIFDDNQQHSAWNFSDDERVVLYVDFKISPPQTIKQMNR